MCISGLSIFLFLVELYLESESIQQAAYLEPAILNPNINQLATGKSYFLVSEHASQ